MDMNTTLLARWFDVPCIHALEKFFCLLIQASYFRQGSHHSMETRLLSLGSLSHCNQVRLSWRALYCPCHLSKNLVPVFLLRLARIKARTTTSTCTFSNGHFDRQVPCVTGHLLRMLGKWPMADCYIEPCMANACITNGVYQERIRTGG